MNRKCLILLCLFHIFCKSIVFDDGFHPVEGFQIDNHRLFLVFGIRDIFSGYCLHACISPVFIWESIKELVWRGSDTHERVFLICAIRKRLREQCLRQPLAPPARRFNLAINGIRTLKQRIDTADELVLLDLGNNSARGMVEYKVNCEDRNFQY